VFKFREIALDRLTIDEDRSVVGTVDVTTGFSGGWEASRGVGVKLAPPMEFPPGTATAVVVGCVVVEGCGVDVVPPMRVKMSRNCSLIEANSALAGVVLALVLGPGAMLLEVITAFPFVPGNTAGGFGNPDKKLESLESAERRPTINERLLARPSTVSPVGNAAAVAPLLTVLVAPVVPTKPLFTAPKLLLGLTPAPGLG